MGHFSFQNTGKITKLIAIFAIVVTSLASQAQDQPEAPAEKAKREDELRATEQKLQSGIESRERLADEIELLRTDRARLNQRLIDTTDRLRATELRISAIEKQLASLSEAEAKIRNSLNTRQQLISEVLAALQRMGKTPQPAILFAPEDMLAAIRAALALGAILPDLREETDVLAEDLGALVRVKLATASEREKLALDQDSLNRDREDLAVLIDARQKELIGTESKINEEIGKSEALAAKAQNLKELLGRLEKELDTSSKVADEAKKAAARTDMEARIANDPAAREARSRFAALAFKDPARMSPKVSFNELKGLLPHPVSGTMVKGFNVPDSLGNPSKGISVATRPGTIVSAPCDGWIAFSGPFRSYGQLLIINAGGGYYVLLAGMERANVTLGQFVLAGEPLAVMGGLPKGGIESGLAGTDKPEPVLYIEFRKDGTSIDPAPWWVSGSNEKVRG